MNEIVPDKNVEKNIEGSKNVFLGALQGISPSFNVIIPKFVYHYTTVENFKSILDSRTIRLFTIANLEDQNERRISFKIEKDVVGTLRDETTGFTSDIQAIINKELSDENVFIQSNSNDGRNSYLWKNYASNNRGVCLKLSTESYLETVNSLLLAVDSKTVPDDYKCFSIVYDASGFDPFLEQVKKACFGGKLQVDEGAKAGIKVFWFFWLEYLRNFIKEKKYSPEKEVRFVVSDYYSIYLKVMSIIARFKGNFPDCDGALLSERFLKEYSTRRAIFYKQMQFQEYKKNKFITIPLYDVLASVEIGKCSPLTKNDVSKLSKRKIQKQNINKLF